MEAAVADLPIFPGNEKQDADAPTGPDGGTGVLSSCGLALEDCAIVASKPLRATNQHAGEVAATDTWVYWAADKLYRFKRTL